MKKQQQVQFTFRRDRHGNLRVEDFDSTNVPWADDRHDRKRERREQRSLKYADRFMST